MKISGFSFAKDIEKLYYPFAESIKSILPICDEFVIAIGKGGPGDKTRKIVEDIGSQKIKIIDTDWNAATYQKGLILSQQTNVALRECSGDWCFYIQADEVVHEKYLQIVYDRCSGLLCDDDVEGLLFGYKHFWGDYDHYHISHAWYPNEIRVIKNHRGIESWGDAQSFRCKEEKIKVVRVNAEVYHYGWVRPPDLMQTKKKSIGKFWGENDHSAVTKFDYGSLENVPNFTETHPAVMKEWISRMNWKDQLQYKGKSLVRNKHERFKYRLLTFLEQKMLGGKQIGGFKNYILLDK
jgi:glycosyltransferase involved in cell wall biosynthesis